MWWLRTETPEPGLWIQTPALPFIRRVTLGAILSAASDMVDDFQLHFWKLFRSHGRKEEATRTLTKCLQIAQGWGPWICPILWYNFLVQI